MGLLQELDKGAAEHSGLEPLGTGRFVEFLTIFLYQRGARRLSECGTFFQWSDIIRAYHSRSLSVSAGRALTLALASRRRACLSLSLSPWSRSLVRFRFLEVKLAFGLFLRINSTGVVAVIVGTVASEIRFVVSRSLRGGSLF